MLTRTQFIHQLLLDQNIDPAEATEAQLTEANTEYTRYYNREKKRESRSRCVTKEVNFSKDEATMIAANAQRHSMAVGPFIKAATLAYLRKTFVLPDDEQVRQVVFQIRKVGNLINQLTHLAHQRQSVFQQDLIDLRNHLNTIEDTVHAAMKRPASIEDLIEEAIQANPDVLALLHRILECHSPQ